MSTRQIRIFLVFISFWLFFYSAQAAQAVDIKVGVYKGLGSEGILAVLKETPGIQAEALDLFTPGTISRCQIVIWPWGRLQSGDTVRPWRAILTAYVKAGGGLILTHDAAGYRGDMKDNPLFPEIATAAGRKESAILKKIPGAVHPISLFLPSELTHAYYDHITLKPGPAGKAILADLDGDPVVVTGQAGSGRVVVMGNIPGYQGNLPTTKEGISYAENEKEAPPVNGERQLLVESVKWSGQGPLFKTVSPEALEAILTKASNKAILEITGQREPVPVFGYQGTSNWISQEKWVQEKNPGFIYDGYWYGDGHGGNWGCVCETTTADKQLSTRSFLRSPVKGEFLVEFDLMRYAMYAGILDVSLVNREGAGYAVRLVLMDDKNPLDATMTTRTDNRNWDVQIGDSVNGISRIDSRRGLSRADPLWNPVEVNRTVIADAVGNNRRIRYPREVSSLLVRFSRSADSEITLSIDGQVVARATDASQDNFEAVVFNMPTPQGRMAFTNLKVVGYFPKETEAAAVPPPWIIPEPKEMKRNGEKFLLSSGFQFVVADNGKIDTYCLDEAIEEIAGRFGILVKVVTPETMDKTKPAIYLGESSDPKMVNLFSPEMKKAGLKDPGPEGYLLSVTKDRVEATGADTNGTFYALQSLVQLIHRDESGVYLVGVKVKDWPDFKMRGSQIELTKHCNVGDRIDNAKRCIRMMARFKANTWVAGTRRTDFPSFPMLFGYDNLWKFNEEMEIYRYAKKHHLEVIPLVYGLSHTGLKLPYYVKQYKPEFWKWLVDNKVLLDPDSEVWYLDSFNPSSPQAWDIILKTNQDVLDAFPTRIVHIGDDEVKPRLNLLEPERDPAEMFLECLCKHHKFLAGQGVRMMMYTDYIEEVGKSGDAKVTSSNPTYNEITTNRIIDRVPKDIIMVKWYYGTKPERPEYSCWKQKGFDVIAMPGSCYNAIYESAYYAAIEGKKDGILGVISFGQDVGGPHLNPQVSYILPLLYSWTVPEKMKPDWVWQEVWQETFRGPLPSHLGRMVPVDISAAYNETRRDEKPNDGQGWLDYGSAADLKDLPAGELAYKQYRFRIAGEEAPGKKSVIIVDNKKEKTVKDIPVKTKARSLVFLQASTGFNLGINHSKPIGSYTVHYEDGSTLEVLIVYGQTIGPWLFSMWTGMEFYDSFYTHGYYSFSRLAYQGRTALGDPTGLQSYEWVNPQPDKTIVSIDMAITINDSVRIALVALTAVQ